MGRGKSPDPCLRQSPACRVTNGKHVAHTWSRYSLRASRTKSLDDALAAHCLATCTNRPQPHTVLWHSVDDIPRRMAVSALACRLGNKLRIRPDTETGRPMADRLFRSLPAASFLANKRQAFAKPVARRRTKHDRRPTRECPALMLPHQSHGPAPLRTVLSCPTKSGAQTLSGCRTRPTPATVAQYCGCWDVSPPRRLSSYTVVRKLHTCRLPPRSYHVASTLNSPFEFMPPFLCLSHSDAVPNLSKTSQCYSGAASSRDE